MTNMLILVGMPIVGVLAIAYAIVDCIRMSKGTSPVKMTLETEEYMSRLILKIARVEFAILFFVIVTSTILWNSMETLEAKFITIIGSTCYVLLWLDIAMMALTFTLVYQIHLNKQ